jgi:hypothetical protein
MKGARAVFGSGFIQIYQFPLGVQPVFRVDFALSEFNSSKIDHLE